MKEVTVYLRGDTLYIVGLNVTTEGLWGGSDSVFSVDRSDTEKIEEDLRRALDISGRETPHPKSQQEWNAMGSSTLEAAGVKNWPEFVQGTKALQVSLVDHTLRLLPTKSDHKQGWAHLNEESEEFSVNDPSLGVKVLQLLDEKCS